MSIRVVEGSVTPGSEKDVELLLGTPITDDNTGKTYPNAMSLIVERYKQKLAAEKDNDNARAHDIDVSTN